ncbi:MULTISPECIES: hypothetical protein [Aerosakkonema]|uniref:hypothetical protein n=1 Tax=Aerosakkonema TaxID=1246629 RepID=UPI0035BB3B9B
MSEHNNNNGNNNTHESASLTTKQNSSAKPKWDEDSIAQLLGLRERGVESANSTAKLTADNENESADENVETSKAQPESGNIISQAELFEEENLDSDPHKAKSQATLSSNPLAKLGLVGLGTFAIFFVGGLFLNNIMNTKIKPSPTAQQLPNPLTEKKEQESKDAETAKLKTQLALGAQEEQLAALNRSKSPKNREVNNKPVKEQTTASTITNQPKPISSSPPPAVPSRVPPASPPPPPRVITRYVTRTVPVPTPVVTRPTPVAITPQPRLAPAPVVQPVATTRPTPVAITPQPRLASAPVVQPIATTRPTPVPTTPPPTLRPIPTPPQQQERKEEPQKIAPIDPMKQWMALQKLGSYGEVPFEESDNEQATSVAVNPTNGSAALPIGGRETEQVVSATPVNSQITPTPTQNSVEVATVPRATPVERTTAISSSPEDTTSSEEASIIAGVPVENVSNEEYNILTGTPLSEVRNLQVGQQAEAVLVTPVIATIDSSTNNDIQVASVRSTGNIASSSNAQEERFVVQLNQSLVDSLGQALLPPGTLAVFEVKSVHPSGMVDCDAIALIINQKEYLLPPGSISIRGEEGKPLMAQKYDDKGLEIASMDVSTVVFGSLANLGRVLNQPRSEEIDDLDSVFGSRRRTRVDRNKPNILGAVLEGGFTPLLQQIQRRNSRAIAQIQSRPNLWYITPNQKVVVFVNRSFDL